MDLADRGAGAPNPPHASADGRRWPRIFEVRPGVVLGGITLLVAAAWTRLVVDVFTPGTDPVWFNLFNDGPVEWVQWLLLPATAVSATWLSAHLRGGAASFFILLAVGTSLMLFEDAGDVRHVISDNVVLWAGNTIGDLAAETLSDLVYYSLLAAVPMYALLRYGRYVWSAPGAGRYVLGGYGLYAFAAMGSGLKWVGDYYIRAGRLIDERVFGGRLPVPADWPVEAGWFELMDGPIEEVLETFGAACLLGVVLAYATAWRYPNGMSPSPDQVPDTRSDNR